MWWLKVSPALTKVRSRRYRMVLLEAETIHVKLAGRVDVAPRDARADDDLAEVRRATALSVRCSCR
jgi:hypothetical protein